MVSIAELSRGVDTDRRCPDCGADDVVRFGESRVHHGGGPTWLSEEQFTCATCRHDFTEEYEPGEVVV